MDGKRPRGWLPPLEPTRFRRRRFESSGNENSAPQDAVPAPNIPAPRSPIHVWEVPPEHNLEATIEEDVEPAPEDDMRLLQPIQTNLMGVDWGRDNKENDYGLTQEAEDERETVGGSYLDDIGIEEGENSQALEQDRDDDTAFMYFPPNDELQTEHTQHEAENNADDPSAVARDVNLTAGSGDVSSADVLLDLASETAEGAGDREGVVVDGRNEAYFDQCGEEFHLALMLFVTSADLSTTQYEALTEVLALATTETIKSLPKSIKTLQQRCRRGFPLMQLKGKLVDVDLRQIPPKKETPRNAYFFEPSEYCKVWLSSPTIRQSLHQGLGEYVDVASELWHGDAWMESMRSTSGSFAYIKEGGAAADHSVPLLPSDCVEYTNTEGITAIGRVKCVGIDKRQGAINQASALINPLIRPHELRAQWETPENSPDPFPEYAWVDSNLPELILVEHQREIVPCTNI
ncbi:uncharacterized protein H6S33_005565 [Morchella sextelata]|uniref:uncharacterized protein n=1 Tax=Morchella sextelata TaxID=1174677 RepID=UPI001D0483FD|nr:uncharacterized protein H6S33_005565 [Morchella sextelata]KAH0613679.1 hypothetical protein H6S33_005565 [Morchella sextelata]